MTHPRMTHTPMLSLSLALFQQVYAAGSVVQEVTPGVGARAVNVTSLPPLTAHRVALTVTIAGALSATSDQSPSYFTQPNATSRPKEVARVQFKLPGAFLAQLEDSASTAFKTLAAELKSAVESLFASTVGTQGFVVLSFAEGSIVVTANLTTTNGPPLEAVVLQLQQGVDGGDVGGLATVSGSFERLADAPAEGTCSAADGSTAAVPVAATGAIGGVLLVVVVVVAVVYCRARSARSGFNKSGVCALVSACLWCLCLS